MWKKNYSSHGTFKAETLWSELNSNYYKILLKKYSLNKWFFCVWFKYINYGVNQAHKVWCESSANVWKCYSGKSVMIYIYIYMYSNCDNYTLSPVPQQLMWCHPSLANLVHILFKPILFYYCYSSILKWLFYLYILHDFLNHICLQV